MQHPNSHPLGKINSMQNLTVHVCIIKITTRRLIVRQHK